MAGSVEPVLPDTVFFIILIRDGVHERIIRHRLVERGIEDRNLWYTRQQLLAGEDPLEVSGIVQGCQLGALFYVALDIVVNQHRLFEVFASVRYTVTYCLNLRDAFYDAMHRVYQCIHNHVDTDGMVWYVQDHLIGILAGWLVSEDAVCDADSFNQSFCQHPGAVLHVKKLILD